MRTPVENIIDHLVTDLELVMEALEPVMEAFDPPLDIEAAWDMVKEGPTQEQRYMGVLKVFGGMKIDGSIHQVEIL